MEREKPERTPGTTPAPVSGSASDGQCRRPKERVGEKSTGPSAPASPPGLTALLCPADSAPPPGPAWEFPAFPLSSQLVLSQEMTHLPPHRQNRSHQETPRLSPITPQTSHIHELSLLPTYCKGRVLLPIKTPVSPLVLPNCLLSLQRSLLANPADGIGGPSSSPCPLP